MAHPHVAFRVLVEGERRLVDLPAAPGDLFEARLARLSAILGREFGANAVPVSAAREGVTLSGYAGVPTLNQDDGIHPNAEGQRKIAEMLYPLLRSMVDRAGSGRP